MKLGPLLSSVTAVVELLRSGVYGEILRKDGLNVEQLTLVSPLTTYSVKEMSNIMEDGKAPPPLGCDVANCQLDRADIYINMLTRKKQQELKLFVYYNTILWRNLYCNRQVKKNTENSQRNTIMQWWRYVQ